jgi:hypothetical protein
MKLQSLAAAVVVGLAVWSGIGGDSFWWVLIPAFFAGSLGLSNGPHYAAVVEANRQGSLTLFPMMLAIYWISYTALAGLVYGLTRLIA